MCQKISKRNNRIREYLLFYLNLKANVVKVRKNKLEANMNSKAFGEPPLMYGIGAYFAIREAVKLFNQDILPQFDAPFTAEKVLMNLYDEKGEDMKWRT
jgi:xanthine dehydrogenase molybdopterin-binding subunit B